MPDTAPGNPAAKYHCAALPVNITCADCHHCQRGNAVLGYTGFRIINFTRLAGPGKPEPALPFVLEQTEVFGGCASSMWAFVRYSKGSLPEDKVRKLDIDLCAEDGEVCVRMKGLTLRVQASERVIDGMFIFFQVPNLYIRQIPGDHYTMLRGSNVLVLAEEMSQLLAKYYSLSGFSKNS